MGYAKVIHRDGRAYMVVNYLEPIEDEKGHISFNEYDKEEDITGREDRESDFCKLCKYGKYPECVKNCKRGQIK